MSIVAYLSPGLTFRRGPATYQVRQMTDDDHLVMESTPNTFTKLSLDQFLAEHLAGHIYDLRSEGVPFNPEPSQRIVLSAQWDNASPAARKRAERAFAYITSLEALGPVVFDTKGNLANQLAEVATKLGDHKPPSRGAFFVWHTKFIRGGRSIEALLPLAPPRGLHRRRSRLPASAVTILELHLQRYREGRFNRTGAEWVAEVNKCIAEYNASVGELRRIRVITVSTWNRRLKEIDALTRAKVVRGKPVAEREYAAVVAQPIPRYPLQVVEVDHTRLQIEVYDPATDQVHSEVWMTTMMDRCTRMVLGFTLHIVRHDHEVAAKCYAMAALPKLNLRAWCPDAKNDWPCFGIMTLLLCDDGAEFLYREFGRFCTRMGTNIAYAPVYTPEWKGMIERYHRTIKQSLISRLEGARARGNVPKPPSKCKKNVNAPTLDELTTVVGRWMVDCYHQTEHSALGMSPQQAWQQRVGTIHIPLVKSVDDLLIRAGRTEERTLTRQGIELEGDYYHSQELSNLLALIGTKAPKVRVVSHVNCAYRIFVINPLTDEFVIAENQHLGCRPEYTRSQWKGIKRTAKENGLNSISHVERDTAAAIVEATNVQIVGKRKAKQSDIARQPHNRDRSSTSLTNPKTPFRDAGQSTPKTVVPHLGNLPDLPSIDDLIS